MSEPSAQANVLAERLESREFVYMAELVASATKREEEVLEVAARMGAVPQIAAIGVTSYAGGATGHDPVRIAAGVASLGLTPNIHLTCVGQDRKGIANTLATLESLRIHNTFCISGDWPKNSPDAARLRRRFGAAGGGGVRPPAEARHAVPHLVRGVALQVPARGLPLSVR